MNTPAALRNRLTIYSPVPPAEPQPTPYDNTASGERVLSHHSIPGRGLRAEKTTRLHSLNDGTGIERGWQRSGAEQSSSERSWYQCWVAQLQLESDQRNICPSYL